MSLIIHEKLESLIVHHQKYISGRILLIIIFKINRESTHILSIYAPESGKPKEDVIYFYALVQKTLLELTSGGKIIIMGDAIGKIGNQPIPVIKQIHNVAVLNDNGEILIEFCARNSLRINNTFFRQKQQQNITWSNTRGHSSTIECILTEESFPLKY